MEWFFGKLGPFKGMIMNTTNRIKKKRTLQMWLKL